MNYSLPTSLTVNGTEYEIESDYRRALDILEAMTDPDLDGNDRVQLILEGLYKDFEAIPRKDWKEAVERAVWFIDGGEEREEVKGPRLMDWTQDFRYIVAPVNRVVGQDVRGVPYLHWWSLLSAFYEIGECTFSQIVGIRAKKARGKKLDDSEREFYRRNKKAVDFQRNYSAAENDLVAKWT